MLLYGVLLILIILLHQSMRLGGAPEKAAVLALFLNFLLNAANLKWNGTSEFARYDPVAGFGDLVLSIVFGWILVRANRVWPILMFALQLVVLLGHLSMLLSLRGVNWAYWAMTTIPQYIQVIALFSAIFLHSRRKKKYGPYRDWK